MVDTNGPPPLALSTHTDASTPTGKATSASQDTNTLQTSFHTEHTATTTSSILVDQSTSMPSQLSSSTLRLGPATTAAPLPGAAATQPTHDNASSSPGFSKGSRDVVITITTIGGTLILAFLLYALWRRRKGATYSEIVRFRPHSGTIIMDSSPRDPHFTALPIYRESRYSVRSSRHSLGSAHKALKRALGVPLPGTPTVPTQNAWIPQSWKTTTPVSPIPERQKHPLADVENSSQLPKRPEMVRVATDTSVSSRQPLQPSNYASKSGLAITTREASPVRDEGMSQPAFLNTDPDPENRWSWTNSQAPPTPRFAAPSLHSSISSLPRFRSVKSWIRTQSERQTSRVQEEPPAPPRPKPATPPLKNKAQVPVLAPPKPTRKLSKRRQSSNSVNERYKSDEKPPLLPEPALTKEQRRPPTAPPTTPQTKTFLESLEEL